MRTLRVLEIVLRGRNDQRRNRSIRLNRPCVAGRLSHLRQLVASCAIVDLGRRQADSRLEFACQLTMVRAATVIRHTFAKLRRGVMARRVMRDQRQVPHTGQSQYEKNRNLPKHRHQNITCVGAICLQSIIAANTSKVNAVDGKV